VAVVDGREVGRGEEDVAAIDGGDGADAREDGGEPRVGVARRQHRELAREHAEEPAVGELALLLAVAARQLVELGTEALELVRRREGRHGGAEARIFEGARRENAPIRKSHPGVRYGSSPRRIWTWGGYRAVSSRKKTSGWVAHLPPTPPTDLPRREASNARRSPCTGHPLEGDPGSDREHDETHPPGASLRAFASRMKPRRTHVSPGL
jgi:hypothetical protein